jgi:hypothetical protein
VFGENNRAGHGGFSSSAGFYEKGSLSNKKVTYLFPFTYYTSLLWLELAG